MSRCESFRDVGRPYRRGEIDEGKAITQLPPRVDLINGCSRIGVCERVAVDGLRFSSLHVSDLGAGVRGYGSQGANSREVGLSDAARDIVPGHNGMFEGSPVSLFTADGRAAAR